MDIYEFARESGEVLELTLIPGGDRFGGDRGGYWYHFNFIDRGGAPAEVFRHDDGQTDALFGIGNSPEGAIANYVTKIRGKRLRFHQLEELVDVPEALQANPLPISDREVYRIEQVDG